LNILAPLHQHDLAEILVAQHFDRLDARAFQCQQVAFA
jgi:hypothetical protein